MFRALEGIEAGECRGKRLSKPAPEVGGRLGRQSDVASRMNLDERSPRPQGATDQVLPDASRGQEMQEVQAVELASGRPDGSSADAGQHLDLLIAEFLGENLERLLVADRLVQTSDHLPDVDLAVLPEEAASEVRHDLLDIAFRDDTVGGFPLKRLLDPLGTAVSDPARRQKTIEIALHGLHEINCAKHLRHPCLLLRHNHRSLAPSPYYGGRSSTKGRKSRIACRLFFPS